MKLDTLTFHIQSCPLPYSDVSNPHARFGDIFSDKFAEALAKHILHKLEGHPKAITMKIPEVIDHLSPPQYIGCDGYYIEVLRVDHLPEKYVLGIHFSNLHEGRPCVTLNKDNSLPESYYEKCRKYLKKAREYHPDWWGKKLEKMLARYCLDYLLRDE